MLEEYSGHIEVIMGPMFSGKSTELVRRMRRYQCAKLRCLVVKYAGDTRYSVECMSTHDRYVRGVGLSRELARSIKGWGVRVRERAGSDESVAVSVRAFSCARVDKRCRRFRPSC